MSDPKFRDCVRYVLNVGNWVDEECLEIKESGGKSQYLFSLGTPYTDPGYAPIDPPSQSSDYVVSGTSGIISVQGVEPVNGSNGKFWTQEYNDKYFPGGIPANQGMLAEVKSPYWAFRLTRTTCNFDNVLSNLALMRQIYKPSDGYRVVAVQNEVTPLTEEPLSEYWDIRNEKQEGSTVAGDESFFGNMENKSGTGEGSSAEDYAGEDNPVDTDLTNKIARLHENGDETGVVHANDKLTFTPPQSVLTLSGTHDEKKEDSPGFGNYFDETNVKSPSIQVNLLDDKWEQYLDTTSSWQPLGATPQLSYQRKGVRKDMTQVTKIVVYLRKTTEEKKVTPVEKVKDKPAFRLPDPGSYSNKIDGGVNDRSLGQRFQGASYSDFVGYNQDNEVMFDSLYVPETSRWGENLDFTDPDTEYHYKKLGKSIVGGEGDFLSYDMYIEEITKNLSDASTMTFVENIKYDDVGANIILNGTASTTGSEQAGFEASKAFDWLDNTYYQSQVGGASLMYDFQRTVIAETTLTVGCTAGDASITVGDTSDLPSKGNVILNGTDYVSYESKTAATLTGIPADGDFAVDTHLSGVSVTWELSHVSRQIKKYAIKVRTTNPENYPKDWVFQGSNDATNWDDLDTQTGVTWESGEEKVFSCLDNVTNYRYYRLKDLVPTGDIGTYPVEIVDVQMFESDTWDTGSWVYGALVTPTGAQTVFHGIIVSKQRTLSENGQIVRYQAAGLIQKLNELGFAFEISLRDKNIQEIAQIIVDAIPNSIITSAEGIELLPTTVVPEIDWQTITYKRALDMLMDQAGQYGYYLDTNRVLRFINLKYNADEDTSRQITYEIPEEGEAYDDTKHFVLNKELSIDVTQAKTKCMAHGEKIEIELTEIIPVVESAEGQTPPYALIVESSDATPPGAYERTFLVVLSNTDVQAQLLSDEDKAIDVKTYYPSFRVGSVRFAKGWWNPRNNPFNFVIHDTFSAFNISAYNFAQEFKVTYVYKSSTPVYADTGWIGTAYEDFNVQTSHIILDTRFRKQIVQGEVIRDDSGELLKYAKQLIEPYKDWYLGGSVELNDVRYELELDKFINFSGTTQDWTDINAFVKMIRWDFVNHQTSIDLTNNYFVGAFIDPEVAVEKKVIEDSEEIQRILARLKKLEINTNQF